MDRAEGGQRQAAAGRSSLEVNASHSVHGDIYVKERFSGVVCGGGGGGVYVICAGALLSFYHTGSC